jgi:hypothetical protein
VKDTDFRRSGVIVIVEMATSIRLEAIAANSA